MTELEHVTNAIREHSEYWWNCDGEPNDGLAEALAKAAIAAIDSFRSAEKRRTCKHNNRIGTGCASSDGSGWSTWYCQECGASYDSRKPLTLTSGQGK